MLSANGGVAIGLSMVYAQAACADTLPVLAASHLGHLLTRPAARNVTAAEANVHIGHLELSCVDWGVPGLLGSF